MSRLTLMALLAAAALAAPGVAQGPADTGGVMDSGVLDAPLDPSTTAAPISVTDTPPEPVNPALDPVNVEARAEVALGLVMEIRVNSKELELQRISLMQVRAVARGDDVTVTRREGRIVPRADGDWVVVEALESDGDLISRTAVSDSTVSVVEEGGLLPVEERLLYASLPTPRRVGTLSITSTANGVSRTIDIAPVFEQYCADTPSARLCLTP